MIPVSEMSHLFFKMDHNYFNKIQGSFNYIFFNGMTITKKISQEKINFYFLLQGYVSCAWGVSNVGYVLITYGVVDAICSATFGNFIQYVGRVPIFLGGAFLNIICLVILWTWTPNPDQSYVFFFIAALWGAGDAVWQTQINGEFLKANFFLKVR